MNSIFIILQIIKITFKTVEINIRANYDTFRSPINAARLSALFEAFTQTANSIRSRNEAISMKEKTACEIGDRKDSFRRNLFFNHLKRYRQISK